MRAALLDLSGVALGATVLTPHGQWLTGAYVEFLDDGRLVRLWDDLSFRDPRGRVHTAKAGTVSDGSSHPKLSWSHYGGPYSGKYRRAALLHDALLAQAKVDPTMSVELAHQVFREAMLADGVPEQHADEFFVAVTGYSYWKALTPVVGFLKTAWRVLRRVKLW